MENAVDALKIAFAIIVFVIGLTVLFYMTSLCKEASRILISETDDTNYYTYIESDDTEDLIDGNGNRIVTLSDIIPVLYRYAQENYGVTIIGDGEIVARFDYNTEVMCNNWRSLSDDDDTKLNFCTETAKIYEEVAKVSGNTVIDRVANDVSTVNGMTKLFERIYAQESSTYSNRAYYCAWIGTYSNGLIPQRVDSDISRNHSIF